MDAPKRQTPPAKEAAPPPAHTLSASSLLKILNTRPLPNPKGFSHSKAILRDGTILLVRTPHEQGRLDRSNDRVPHTLPQGQKKDRRERKGLRMKKKLILDTLDGVLRQMK
jgi:hypothetical protein